MRTHALYLTVALIAIALPSIGYADPISVGVAAQKALPSFLKIVSERPGWAGKFRVFATLTDGKETEDFWLADFRKEDSGYSAQLRTIPRRLRNVRSGQRVQLTTESIKDWTYDDSRDEMTHGHFFICDEFAGLPNHDAKEQMEYWRLSCKP
jgi:uncharacterized protein YegJ (DUF2314 family)